MFIDHVTLFSTDKMWEIVLGVLGNEKANAYPKPCSLVCFYQYLNKAQGTLETLGAKNTQRTAK